MDKGAAKAEGGTPAPRGKNRTARVVFAANKGMTILRYTIRHKIYVRHSISVAYATEILITGHNLQELIRR